MNAYVFGIPDLKQGIFCCSSWKKKYNRNLLFRSYILQWIMSFYFTRWYTILTLIKQPFSRVLTESNKDPVNAVMIYESSVISKSVGVVFSTVPAKISDNWLLRERKQATIFLLALKLCACPDDSLLAKSLFPRQPTPSSNYSRRCVFKLRWGKQVFRLEKKHWVSVLCMRRPHRISVTLHQNLQCWIVMVAVLMSNCCWARLAVNIQTKKWSNLNFRTHKYEITRRK